MASFNSCILLGNLTRDPELRYTPSGTAVVDIGLAVNRAWTSEAGEKKEEVSFFNLTAFGRTAEVCAQYLKKGDPALFSGRLKQETWDDKQTGQKRSAVKVIVEHMQMLGARREGDSRAPAAARPAKAATESPYEPAEPDSDNIPF